MAKIIIYDFEVFKKNTLLGVIEIENDRETLWQTWDLQEIRDYYEQNKNAVWAGHNNMAYDDVILETIVKKGNPYLKSQQIVHTKDKPRCNLPIASFDIMQAMGGKISLKLTELIIGKNIHTTDVDFNIDRELTEEEKRLTEEYNADDLYQTLYNFKMFYNNFALRVDMAKEFNVDLKLLLNATQATMAAIILGVKKDASLANKPIKPVLPKTLQVKNQDVLDYYLSGAFMDKDRNRRKVHICGADFELCSGGLHYAKPKFACEKVMYFDVSGYYNLVMINYDCFSRAIPESGKELYKYMYHQQLALKKTNPIKRASYKTVLLAVYGATGNEHCEFYDPWKVPYVPVLGQLFICDLLEKLEGLIDVVQINTDGIMIVPLDWNNEQQIKDIVNAWEERTGFTIKKEYAYNLWQRDVNNYVCLDNNHVLEYKGEMFKNYDISENGYKTGGIFDSKEPSIIAKGVIDFLVYGITPEETVEKYKSDVRNFQYACKKGTFDYLTYEVENVDFMFGYVEPTVTRLQGVDRAFAYNSTEEVGMIYKYKREFNGMLKKSKVSNLPSNVFVFNENILDEKNKQEIMSKLNYDYYIGRIYERLGEMVEQD